ncbi:MAG: hypothetical protein JRG94_19185 [Deltaproteobacteria bacterium]|nr:hypothetical protein [Deltaproteobacteria bacterium]
MRRITTPPPWRPTRTCRCARADIGRGREDQLYFFDEQSGKIAKAPRGSLEFDGVQALSGSYTAKLADGSEVEVTPGFELLRAKLNREHRPEQASEVCGIHPDVIRDFAHSPTRWRASALAASSASPHPSSTTAT